ncbi:MAG: glycoside hydrolase family 26 protein [Jatrophihabitans sp.]|uniref:glycoside hydrolase family 26 protein n=1 Tax=Jatrophihabitans sp. TaxID=1932789 RepID=UPI003F81FBA2
MTVVPPARPRTRRHGRAVLLAAALAVVAALVAELVGGGAAGAAARRHPHRAHQHRTHHRPHHHAPASRSAGTTTAPAPTQRPAASPRPSTTPTVARSWGVTGPGVPSDLSGLDQLTGATGSAPGVVMFYVAWSLHSAFPTASAAAIAQHHAVPEVTWEPWDPSQGVTQPTYSLARITSGAFDSYLRSWAQGIKAYGAPVRLRFAHEMNGSWYPWAEGVNGNKPGSYVVAWNHVRAVFAKAGVRNVTWVWCPNVPFTGSTPLGGLFPGDANVDEVALDGYNWGTTQSWGSTWQSFAQVFGPGVAQLSSLSTKPISIGEVGTTDVGGDKPQWIRDMWTTLASWPRVRGLVWFDFAKECDWRIESSADSFAAFTGGLAGYLAG